MSWNSIVRVDPAKAASPADGVRVSRRGQGSGASGGYIAIQIGSELAKRMGLAGDSVGVRLMTGSDNDAGKLAVVLDPHGAFQAKGKPGKNYRIAIGMKSARLAGFATDFPSFDRAGIEVIKPDNGQPRMFSFLLTRDAIATD